MDVYDPRPRILPWCLSLTSVSRLLHGINEDEQESRPKKRRAQKSREWRGALGLSVGSLGVQDVTERQHGRWDYELSDALYSRLLSEEERSRLLAHASAAAKRLGVDSAALYTSFHVMIVEPGAVDQTWHCDNTVPSVFLTFIMALTPPVPGCGQTEFDRLDKLPPLNVGQCLVFDGKEKHRGAANKSTSRRIFAYLVISSDPVDANAVFAPAQLGQLADRDVDFGHFDGLDHDGVPFRVKIGSWYCFYGSDNETWEGCVTRIFKEDGSEDVHLIVHWLYTDSYCTRVPDFVLSNPKERVLTDHCAEDEPVSVSSVAYPIKVHFAVGMESADEVENPDAFDAIVCKFYSLALGKVRQLESSDIELIVDLSE